MLLVRYKAFLAEGTDVSKEIIAWLRDHYQWVAGVTVPIVVAIIGIFKLREQKNQRTKIQGDGNRTLIGGNDVTNQSSFNSVNQTAGNNSMQASGSINNIILIQNLVENFDKQMYPLSDKAFALLRTNLEKFKAGLYLHLKELPEAELDKFSEVDIQIVLQNAIRGASRTNSTEVHEILMTLIVDRVQKPTHAIAELVLNKSIEIVTELDAALIKTLAFSFMFSQTKFLHVHNFEQLSVNLARIIDEFKNLDVSQSRFGYLESLSCGKTTPFVSPDLIDSISKNYPQLFVKNIPEDRVTELDIDEKLKNIYFLKTDQPNFILNQTIIMHLFENIPLLINGIPSSVDPLIVDKLKILCLENRLTVDEIKTLIFQQLPNFQIILDLWDKKGFTQFSLTPVGVAIGRAYLEQSNFGNYDINVWIK